MEKNKYKLLLTQKNYMRLLIADLISRFGDSLDAIAYSWIMYEITASESLMALIIGLNYVPTVLFQPFLGVLADKMKKKKIMVTMDIVRGIIVGSVILLYSMNMLTPIVLGILTIVTSTVEAIRMPAGTAFLPMVLEKDYYTLGKAANYSFSRSAELVGFVLAGGMISWIGSMGVLFIDMFTFFISAIFIGTIHDSEIIRKTEKGIKLVFEGFKEGLCFFKSNKVIQLVCLIGLLINFGIMPLSVFQTPYVADYLMLGPEMLSVIKICMVLGMSAGAFIVPKITKITKSKLAGIAGIIMGLTLVLMHIAPAFENLIFKIVVCVIAMFCIGFGGGILNVIVGGCMMRCIPKELMGRVSGFIAASMQFSMPIASFICSGLAVYLDVTHIFMFFGSLTVIIYVFMFRRKKLSRLD